MMNLTGEKRVESARQMAEDCRTLIEKNASDNRALPVLEEFFKQVSANNEEACNNPLDLSGLNLTKLPEMILSAIRMGVPHLILSGNPHLIDLSAIRKAPLEVRRATIAHAMESEDLEANRCVLKQLEAACKEHAVSIDLPLEGLDQPPVFIQLLSGLKALHLVGGTSLKDLSTIRNMPILENLIVEDAHSLTELGLANLPKLKMLTLSSCHKLTSLDGIKGLPSVENIQLHDLPLLAGLVSLNGLPKLALLSLDEVPNLSSLDGLEHLPSLTHLELEGENKLTTLKAVEKLPALRMLSIPHSAPESLVNSLRELSLEKELKVMRRIGDKIVKIGHFMQQIGAVVDDLRQHVSCRTLFVEDVRRPDFPATPGRDSSYHTQP